MIQRKKENGKMSVKLKNKEINMLAEFLMGLSLKGRESRMRTRLVRILQEHFQETFLAEQQQLVEEHAEYNEDGEIVTETRTLKDGTKQTVNKIKKENVVEFNRDIQDLLDEEYTIEENDNTKKMLETVANAVFEYDKELSGQKAFQYDRICDMFEKYE